MLESAELVDIRAEAERSLPSICNIVSVGRSRDDRGQVVLVGVTGADFDCAVDPVDIAQEQEFSARIGIRQAWRISMPLDVIVTEHDRIGFDVEGDTGLAEVLGASGPQSDASLRVVVVAEAPDEV